jgi:outer membrane receptor protein involved in Fe transport
MRRLRLVLALALVAPVDAAADDPAPPAPEASVAAPAAAPDEVIVVTGLRLPRTLHDVPAAVTVIDRDQLRRAPEPLTDDLVRVVPSIGTFRRSSSAIADPTSQGLNLRGVGPSGVSRALVLRDGVPVNDPFGGWIYWRALSPLGIDRIEIVPSGASALFGNFALGGVLQVISRPITGPAIDGVVAGGTLGGRRAAARATERLGEFGVALDAESLHSDGYAPITPAQNPATTKPATKEPTSQNSRPLMTKMNRPSVSSVVPVEASRPALRRRRIDVTPDSGVEETLRVLAKPRLR